MTAGHLDTVRLAEHAEGLLAPADADTVEAHLQGCAQCRRTVAELEAVTAKLAAAPRSLATPPEVVARLDRALDAERTADVDTPPAPVVPLSWFRRRAPQLLAAAATVGVVGLAGYAIGVSGQSGDDTAADGAEAATAEAEDAAVEEDAAEMAEPEADDDAAAGTLEEREKGGDSAPFSADPPRTAQADEALEAQIRGVASRARAGAEPELAADCGRPLADELGLELVGTASTQLMDGDAVLVVVDTGESVVVGWVVPSCDGTSDDVRGDPLPVFMD